MLRFIYTGSVDIISQDFLRAADQYLLEGLKRLCEYTTAQVRREYIVSMESDVVGIITNASTSYLLKQRYLSVGLLMIRYGILVVTNDFFSE